jgi:hypothetical protein
MIQTRKQGTVLQRLLRSVEVDNDTGCWIWQGGKNNIGYGLIKDGKGMRTTHRVSWEQHNQRKIPKGMCVCHTCDNPLCVNPDHLWVGDHTANMRDMIAKGRQNFLATRTGPVKTDTCKHCGRVMAVTVLSRWHNDNCKNKAP